MKERVSVFARRTGQRYDPPAGLRALARALRSTESCPTLFRYPGPLGLRDLLQGALGALAPHDSPWVWLSEEAIVERPTATRLFGSVAVLEPLQLDPCRTDTPGHWLAVNRPLPDPESLVWVPPTIVEQPIDWSRVRTAEQARATIGPGYERERMQAVERLSAYLEELSELERSGAPPLATPWCEQPAAERRDLLQRLGISQRWK